jgi:hypothetical protein
VVRAAVATEEEGMAVETAGAVAVQAAETECTKTDSSCRLFGRLATWRRLPLERSLLNNLLHRRCMCKRTCR